MRSAFSLQNQKCSATSPGLRRTGQSPRPFVERLLERTRAMRMGDPTERDVYFGPVINAARGGALRAGGRAGPRGRHGAAWAARGSRGGVFDTGHFVAPTIARLPLTSSLFREELFVPFLAIGEVGSLDQALAETNEAEYGLTAGIFSREPAEVERFFDEIEAGVCYANKRTGATTGAWPGAQPFMRMEGLGVDRQGRVRAVLRAAVRCGSRAGR